jgi:dolichol-phosphate mannosyltransferase
MSSVPKKPAVSVIVPTRNERDNVCEVAERISLALNHVNDWELIFVDDSDDDTPARIRSIRDDLPIHLMHRPPGERAGGLGGAVVAGFSQAAGNILAVMDSDLQHPPELVATLAAAVRLGMADIVVASRFVPGASASGLAGWSRHLVAYVSRQAAHFAVPRSRGVRDPLSGFFALRADVVSGRQIHSDGFKVLLDILAQGAWTTALEIPFVMECRNAGSSKADIREGWKFGHQLLRFRLMSIHPQTTSRFEPWSKDSSQRIPSHIMTNTERAGVLDAGGMIEHSMYTASSN